MNVQEIIKWEKGDYQEDLQGYIYTAQYKNFVITMCPDHLVYELNWSIKENDRIIGNGRAETSTQVVKEINDFLLNK